jgi:hypothetical protein
MSFFAAAGFALSAVGTAAAVAGTFGRADAERAGGRAQRINYESKAAEAEFDAAQQEELILEAKTQARQEEGLRTQKLMNLTGTNLAGLTTQGVSTDSASFQSIMSANREGAAADIGNIQYMGAARVDKARATIEQDKYAANVYRLGGDLAEQQAGFKAAGSLAMGGWQLAQYAPGIGKTMSGAYDWIKGSSAGPGPFGGANAPRPD